MSQGPIDTQSRALRLYGDPVLLMVCQPVQDEAHAKRLTSLFEVMRETVKHPPFNQQTAAGLAANQVGATVRVILVPIAEKMTLCINPVILHTSEASADGQEGCLSVPHFYRRMTRPVTISVRFHDASFASFFADLENWEARVFQHEVDHLNGVDFLDGLSRQQRRQAERAVQRYAGLRP